MKKLILLAIALALFLPCLAHAQGNQYQPNLLTYAGPPTTTCQRNEMALDITNNNLYICSAERNGAWILVGGAGGSQQNGNVCGSLPTSPNLVSQFCTSTPTSGVGGTPTFIKPGLTPRGVYGTTSTDTLQATDFPGIVMYRTSVAVAVSLPTPSTLQLPGAITSLCNQTSPAQTITVTAASPFTFDVTGTATFTLSQNQCARVTVGDQNNTWNAQTFGSASISPGGTGNSIQYNNGGSFGGISGTVTGQTLTATNATVASFQSPGVIDGNGAVHVTTTPYTILCDSSSTLRDRNTTIVFDSGSSVVTIPVHTALGCTGNMSFTLINESGATLTVNPTSPDTVNATGNILNTSSNIGMTTFSLSNNGTARLNNGESGIWNAVLTTVDASPPNGTIYAINLVPGTIAYDASMTATPINSGNSTTATALASNATNVINDSVLQIFMSDTAAFSTAPSCGTVLVNVAYSSTGPKYGLQADYTGVASAGGTAAACTGSYTASSGWQTITLAVAPTSGNTITWRTASTTQQVNGLTLAINKPTGTTTGDYMVACVAWIQGGTANTISPPNTYWTPLSVEDQTISSTHYRVSCWAKVATASEPSSYTWTQVVSNGTTGFIISAQNGLAIDDLITSTSATWTSANVGQDICVNSGASIPKASGIDGAPQACGTIAQVISGTTAICTTCAAAQTVSNVELRYGADNSTTLQNYLNAITGGTKLELPAGLFMCNLESLTNFQLVLPLAPSTQSYTIEGVAGAVSDYQSPSGINPVSTSLGTTIDIATTALVTGGAVAYNRPAPNTLNIGWGIITLKDFAIWGGAGTNRDGGGDGLRWGGSSISSTGVIGLRFSSATNVFLNRLVVGNFAASGAGLITDTVGTFNGGNHVVIDFCTFLENGSVGLVIAGGTSSHFLQNLEIRNSIFENNGIAPSFNHSAGLELGGAINGLEVSTSDFTRNYDNGQLSVQNGLILGGCSFNGNYFESDSPTSNGNGNSTATATTPAGALVSCGINNSFFFSTGGYTPAISSGFGTSPSIPNFNVGNYQTVLTINVGTGGTATSGVVTLTGLGTAANGWDLKCQDTTTQSATVFQTLQTASTSRTATIGNFNTSGSAAAWASGDVLSCIATQY